MSVCVVGSNKLSELRSTLGDLVESTVMPMDSFGTHASLTVRILWLVGQLVLSRISFTLEAAFLQGRVPQRDFAIFWFLHVAFLCWANFVSLLDRGRPCRRHTSWQLRDRARM